jgi:hypothetical protein
MSEKLRVDAGLMKEHKAAVNGALYPRPSSTWNDAVIQDKPDKRPIMGVAKWLLAFALAALVAAGLWYAKHGGVR